MKIVPPRNHVNMQYCENKGITFEKMDFLMITGFFISATNFI